MPRRTASLADGGLLRARIRLFAARGVVVVGLSWAAWTVLGATGAGNPAAAICFGAAAAVMSGLWLGSVLMRRLPLRAAEIAAFLAVAAALSALIPAAPSSVTAAPAAVLALTFLAVLRAALLPGPALLHAVITGAAIAPLGVASVIAWRHGGGSLAALVLGPAAWWAVTTALIGATTAHRFLPGEQLRLSRHVGPYVLERKIGEGGMGVVYRARHALLRRPTALKLMSPAASDPGSVQRFEREVRLASQLSHPNTVTIYDYGIAGDGTFYYVMEFLDGMSLADIVAKDGPQAPERVLAILHQVLGSLAEAHGRGLVHRDIKPSNIILCRFTGLHEVAKVVDFGLAKQVSKIDPHLTDANTLIGSPLFMAPESVISPESYDHRGDLYSVGVLAYFLLTGTTPFEGDNVVEVLSAHLHQTPTPPSERIDKALPEDLERLVLDLLEKNPDRRPDTAAVVGARLEACADYGGWTSERAEIWWARQDVKLRPSMALSA
jgi:serine/threonine-protein kinase